MAVVDELLKSNQKFARTFKQGDLPMPPARNVAILTCTDARLDPLKFLGLRLGDADVIRNAGGRATDDAIRSLIISSHVLGANEFAVIHHTDCSMLTFTNDDLRDKLKENTDVDVSNLEFLPFTDSEETLRGDVELLRHSPFLPKGTPVSGYIYDVKTGKLETVVAADD